MKAILGKKVGMTQIFTEEGNVVPVTVVEAGPCVVVAKKTVESDGYNAIQVGFGAVKENRVNKPEAGQFKKAGVELKKCCASSAQRKSQATKSDKKSRRTCLRTAT